MAKIEVRVSHRTDIYKTSGERSQGWKFISKKENGKWPSEYRSDEAEWSITIEENLNCIKDLTDELEKDFSDRVNEDNYQPIIWELEFDENAGKTDRPDKKGWSKERIFWMDSNVKIKKVSKDNNREREQNYFWRNHSPTHPHSQPLI